MLRTALDNGLRLLVDPAGHADLAAVYLWIDVGSADEPEGLHGAAHFVEHLVFKGTRSYGVGEVAAAIEAMGGDLNAWTSFDETVFHCTVPAARAPDAVGVLAEMATAARFDPDELERERVVVLEEIRGGKEDPDLVVGEALYAALWGDHPYARPIIGTVASVRGMGRERLMGFYRAHYQPSNAVLSVAGPVDVDGVVAAAKRHLGGGEPVRPRVVRPAAGVVGRRKTLRKGFEVTLVEAAWPGPTLGHPEVAALDVLCEALGGAASAAIPRRLRLEEGLCLAAGLHYDVEASAGSAVLSLRPREGAAERSLAVAFEEIERARAGGLPAAEIERARAAILADRVFGRQTVDGRAHTQAWHLVRAGDPDAARAYDAAVAAVDADAVRRAAERWLDPGRATRVALLPERTPAPGRVVVRAPARGGPALRRVTLANGLRLVLHPDGGEVAAARVVGLGGGLFETPAAAGRGQAWARAVTRGAGRRGAVAFAAAVEGLAGGLGAVVGRSTMQLRAELIARSFPAGLELLLDLLLAPRFDAAEVAAVRLDLRQLLDEADDHPDERLADAVWAAALPGHPWGLPGLGTRATLRTHTPAALRALHQRWAVGRNLVVAVAGAFDPDAVERALREGLSGLPAGSVALPSPPAFEPAPRAVSIRAGQEQARVAVAFPALGLTHPDAPALEVLAAALGGQAGRLFVELREAHGLAYEVSATVQDGVQPGLFVAGLATDPERVEEAEARLGETLERVRREGLAAEEVERARAWLLGGIEHERQTAGARASQLAYAERYELGAADWYGEARRRLQAVDADRVRTVAADTLGRPLVRGRALARG